MPKYRTMSPMDDSSYDTGVITYENADRRTAYVARDTCGEGWVVAVSYDDGGSWVPDPEPAPKPIAPLQYGAPRQVTPLNEIVRRARQWMAADPERMIEHVHGRLGFSKHYLFFEMCSATGIVLPRPRKNEGEPAAMARVYGPGMRYPEYAVLDAECYPCPDTFRAWLGQTDGDCPAPLDAMVLRDRLAGYASAA